LRWATTFADFDCAGRGAGRALLFCGLAGVDLRAEVLFPAAVLEAAVLDAGAAALRAGTPFVAIFFDVLLLDEAISLTFVALRAGAFSAAERLMIGFGRAVDLLANERLFPEDVEEF
jgi:hypothetical protein